MKRLLLSALLLTSAPSFAASYLTPAQVDLLALLPPPPVAGSAQDRAELAEVLALQATRTPEQAAATVHDAGETVFDEFGDQLGPKFTPAALPLCTALFDRIGDTEEDLTGPAKKGFARARPFVADPAIHPSAPLSRSGSWPSGHATRVTLTATVLSMMLPEQRAMLFQRAQIYADNRVTGGVHYRSDLEAGFRSGTAAAAVLVHDPAFLQEYAPARAELRKVLGLPG